MNVVIMYNGTSCPPGWSEISQLRGRVPIGINPTTASYYKPGRAIVNSGATSTVAYNHKHTNINHVHFCSSANLSYNTHWNYYPCSGYDGNPNMSRGGGHTHSLNSDTGNVVSYNPAYIDGCPKIYGVLFCKRFFS